MWLCAFAGLRLGEASGVQVADIDFLRRELKVSRQIQRDGRGYKLAPPKYGSERVVSLPDELLAMLAEHVKSLPEGGPDRWLFSIDGQPMHDNAVTWRWRATRKSASLESVRLHDLRHFYASGLIAGGCSVVTVQRGARAFDCYDHLEHVCTPLADRRGPDQEGGGGPDAGGMGDSCGLPADCPSLSSR